jgi:CheY-like chemotaxis protein
MKGAPVVLIVEDEWPVRDTIVKAFRDAGWEVLGAASGEAAMAFLARGQPIDALFTDIQLHGNQNGWDVAEAFALKHPKGAVIYTSGNSSDRKRQIPASLFFDKPYAPLAIIDACEAARDSRLS